MSETVAPVVIRLDLSAAAPLTGVAVVDGQSEGRAFCGWIALMGIVNDACQRLADTPPASEPVTGESPVSGM